MSLPPSNQSLSAFYGTGTWVSSKPASDDLGKTNTRPLRSAALAPLRRPRRWVPGAERLPAAGFSPTATRRRELTSPLPGDRHIDNRPANPDNGGWVEQQSERR